jgi:hypothetical protein
VGKVLLKDGNITHELHCRPGFDLGSNRSEYQGYLLGCDGDRCVGLTNLPPSCADCPEILIKALSFNQEFGFLRTVPSAGFCEEENTWCIQVLRSPNFFLWNGSR